MSVSACRDRGRRPRRRGRRTQGCEMAGGENFVEHDHDDLRSTRRSAGTTPPHGPGRSGSDVSPLPRRGTSTTSLAACTSSGSTRRTHSAIRRSRSGQTGEGSRVQRFGQLVLPLREGREPGTRPAAVTEYPSAGRAAGRGNATDPTGRIRSGSRPLRRKASRAKPYHVVRPAAVPWWTPVGARGPREASCPAFTAVAAASARSAPPTSLQAAQLTTARTGVGSVTSSWSRLSPVTAAPGLAPSCVSTSRLRSPPVPVTSQLVVISARPSP